MDFRPTPAVEAIREAIDHPIIDADGHLIEYLPIVRDLLAEEAGETIAGGLDVVAQSSALLRQVAPAERRRLGLTRTSWWALPTAKTLDRATAMLPELQYRRLDELGIDVAVLYPTYGLTITALPDADLRIPLARAFNRFLAEVYGGHGDRLVPVATIPMHTPDEAVAELEHAVGELGLKAVMMAGAIPRPLAGLEDHRAARFIDGVGLDSTLDYDPVWDTCTRLGVAPTFHASALGWPGRASPTNYVHNHIGSFAVAGEVACRSLLFAGVPRRYPELRFGFQEGGVGWAASLLADLVGHFRKRNADAIGHYDPARLDRDQLRDLVEQYGPATMRSRLDRLTEATTMLSDPDEDRDQLDDFAHSGFATADDIVDVFERQLFFGCEADDPMNALAFATDITGATLPAVFASDVGHWDVPDIREVVPEAWELVERGHLDREQFRAFTFEHAARLWGSSVFADTIVGADVEAATAP